MSALEDRSVQAELPTIPTLYDNLCTNFRQVLIALNGNSMVVDSVALEKAQEEFTRLKIWGVQSRASVSGIHGSFELEERPEIGKLLIDVLKEADDCLLQILPHASVCDTSSLEIMEDSDSDSDSTASSSDGDFHPVSVAMNFKMVFENINELYRLRTLLQKPRLKGRYLHSSRSYQNLPGYQQDYQHVRQKLDCWEMYCSADPDENQVGEGSCTEKISNEPPDQPGISMDELTRRQDAEDASSYKKDVLCRRLAAANSKRRKQIRYWEAHPYQHIQIAEDDMAKPLRNAEVMKVDVQGHQATTTESVKAPTTVRTFSTAPQSAIFPVSSGRHDLAESQTTYEPSIAKHSPHSAARVPDGPSAVDGEGNFECPYCHMALSTDEISTRIDWKRHVFRDLRPYVCTVEDCSDPDRQFVTRYDWMYHESQVHYRQWDCSECDQIFEVKEDFRSHMSSEHQGRWTERQVSLLSQLQERGRDDTAWLSCRLCPAILRKQSYFRHVAAHLEDISLFALPKLVPKSEAEVKSNEVNENHSVNSIGYDIWDTDSDASSRDGSLDRVGDTDAWLRYKIPDEVYIKHAKRLEQEILEKGKELGKDHPATIKSMTTLATIYRNQARLEEAEKLVVEVIERRKRILGSKDPYTLNSMSELASILNIQGKYKEAELMGRQALELYLEVLGAHHPSTQDSMHGLAIMLKNQDKYEESEGLHRQVLRLRTELLGREHPDTMISMHSLAMMLKKQGKYDESEELQFEILALRTEILGPEHPDTLFSMENLASINNRQGRYDEAEELHRKVLKLRKLVLGPEHPATLSSMENLAVIYERLGRYDEADELHRYAQEPRTRLLGPGHPETLRSSRSLELNLSSRVPDASEHV